MCTSVMVFIEPASGSGPGGLFLEAEVLVLVVVSCSAQVSYPFLSFGASVGPAMYQLAFDGLAVVAMAADQLCSLGPHHQQLLGDCLPRVHEGNPDVGGIFTMVETVVS